MGQFNYNYFLLPLRISYVWKCCNCRFGISLLKGGVFVSNKFSDKYYHTSQQQYMARAIVLQGTTRKFEHMNLIKNILTYAITREKENDFEMF